MIEKAIEYIKNFFCEEYSGHDYWHSMRVYHTATELAKKEGANIMVVQLAALLHDVDDMKLSPDTYENKEHAVSFLSDAGVDNETIQFVCNIIDDVSYKGNESVCPATIEGKCVQDADRLDAIGAIGIARAFAYGGNHDRIMYDPDIKPRTNMSAEQYRKNKGTTINHFYEKLFKLKELMNTETAKQIAENREKYMHEFIDEFLLEWNGK